MPSLPFPVVGVGGSAGGMEAFSRILENLPPDPGMAFVLVLHLDPHHQSLVTSILSQVSKMPVAEARDNLAIEVNHVYVIPPNVTMTLTDGHLRLLPRLESRGIHMPIDQFLRSLAAHQHSQSIAVVLSGGGSDGSLGLQEISAEEGITFVQDERSAKHDSMPRSAIMTGCVDFVLPPDGIARELARIGRHPYARRAEATGELSTEDRDELNQVFALLRNTTGIDFTHYKRTTIHRRIRRRMALHGLETLGQYRAYLHEHTSEIQALYQDFLIRVTSFFRDPAAFQSLTNMVFPRLVKDRTGETPIRIWVAGCATGEEVYSFAIALLEYLGEQATSTPIKILATDVNESSLERARTGIYAENIEVDVSPERLRRFFVKVDGRYQVAKMIRDMCVFARHNMLRDPPFSKLDIISCRNVLIYLNLALQKRIIPIFHYALKPGGFLMLGTSETIGSFGDLFELVDERQKIFLKKPGPVPPMPFDFDSGIGALERALRPGEEMSPERAWTALDAQREADHLVMSRYAPPGVIIDDNLNILQFRGRTGPYLEPSPGTASFNLVRMVREGLMFELRKALQQAQTENVPVRRENLPVKNNQGFRTVDIEVLPLRAPPAGSRCFLILFEDAKPTALPASESLPAGEPTDEERKAYEYRIGQLQKELDATREYLQAIIEEHEATNEELKSAHEEILSSNEELQSTNEELQTAKEEMQSANEELATVNEELRHRNLDLGKLNDDLTNLFSGVNIPIVMVGRDLRIRRLTPPAEKVFNLTPSDVGRAISDIRPSLHVDDLDKRIAEVIDSLSVKEEEVQDRGGRWYSLRIRPYVTTDRKIDGASITAVDIDALKRSLDKEQRGRDLMEAIIDAVGTPLVVLDEELQVQRANAAFYQLSGTTVETALQQPFLRLNGGRWDQPGMHDLLEEVVEKDGAPRQLSVTVDLPGGNPHQFDLQVQRITSPPGPARVLITVEDAAKSSK
jgi:two-component system CheB/CheR fusion protein